MTGIKSMVNRVRRAYERNVGDRFCPYCKLWRPLDWFKPPDRKCKECHRNVKKPQRIA